MKTYKMIYILIRLFLYISTITFLHVYNSYVPVLSKITTLM